MKTTNRTAFFQLPEATREELYAHSVVQMVPKGEVLFDEREAVADLLILLEGYVSLFRSSFRGDSRVIFICSAGEMLNEVCLENEKTSVAAKALSDLKFLRISKEAVQELMGSDAAFMQAVFTSLAQKTRRLYHKVGNDNGTYALKNRLAANLWKLARDYGEVHDGGCTVAFEITVNFLSEMMGAKRETVSRALSEMKRAGLISHENGTLTVLDPEGLKNSV